MAEQKKREMLIPLVIVLVITLAVSAYLAMDVLSLEKELKQTTATLTDTQSKLNGEHNKNMQLTSELDAKNAELTQANAELAVTKSELGSTKAKLLQRETELNKTKKQLNETAKNLAEIKEEFTALSSEVTNLDATLSQSIQWFKDNAMLPAVPDFGDQLRNLWYEGFLNNVNLNCVTGEGSSRTLKLACVPFAMEKALSFRYKDDAGDRLYSLAEMIRNEGGDCEDFALFTKGLINLLKNDTKNADLMIEATAYSAGNKYTIYGDPSKGEASWYLENAKGLKLAYLDEVYPYAVCYMMTAEEGHCIVALANYGINGTDDMDALEDAMLFEPQNGQFLGYIGTQLHLCENGDALCDRTSDSVMLVIADDDLYQFTDGEWKGYKRYKESVAVLADEINDRLTQ